MNKTSTNQEPPLLQKHSVSGSSFSHHKFIKMNLKKIVRLLTLTPLALYLLYCFCHFLLTETYPTYLDCGNVVSKSSDEVAIKHGSRTELYLNIQFEKSGFRSIECNPTTYFSKNIGEKACFHLHKEIGGYYNLNNFIGMVVAFLLSIVSFMLFVYYITPESFLV